MPDVTWLSRANRANPATSSAVAIPAVAGQRVTAGIDSTEFTLPARALRLVIERSFDGAAWFEVAAATFAGGVLDSEGNPIGRPSVGVTFDDGLACQVRVRAEPGGRINFGVVGSAG